MNIIEQMDKEFDEIYQNTDDKWCHKCDQFCCYCELCDCAIGRVTGGVYKQFLFQAIRRVLEDVEKLPIDGAVYAGNGEYELVNNNITTLLTQLEDITK